MLAFMAGLLLWLITPSTGLAAKIELADLLDIDPLGYSCIPSQHFEDGADGSPALAFSVTGKTRLPRTCLPDPCARALTPQELSRITGTEPILARFGDEWDDYYARYSDHCRKEIVVSRPRAAKQPITGFWQPILTRASQTQRIDVPSSSRISPFTSSNVLPPSQRSQTPINVVLLKPPSVNDPRVLPLNGARPSPSPVPIPASGWLFAALLLGAGAFARKTKRT